MDLAFKRAPEQAPTGYLPWFQVPNRRSTDATIVFGHSAGPWSSHTGQCIGTR